MDILSKRGTRIALGVAAPLVAAAIVLGVIFGRKPGSGPQSDTPPAPVPAPDDAVRAFDTTSPSFMPSVAVTEPKIIQCPIDEKEFVLKYSSAGGQRRRRQLETQQQPQQQQRSLTEFSTWYVKDFCTGNKIVSCTPCPSTISQASASLSSVALGSSSPPTTDSSQIYKVNPSLSSPPVAETMYDTSAYHIKTRNYNNNDRNLQEGVVPNAPPILQEASRQCIPGDNMSYVFVVEPTESPDECCSFDAAEYVVTFDDEVIAFVGAHGSSSGTSGIEQMIRFGETDIICPSNPPSETLSMAPSIFPSIEPSMEPTITISNVPSVFSSEVPSVSSSGSPSVSPSSSPSTPSPTTSPTLTPTTKSPTASPTEQRKDEESEAEQLPQQPTPSLRPSCKYDQNFNLCIAVDMSGSICSNESGCIGCPSDTCRDEFVTQGTCCNNFAFVKGFASLMIRSLSNFPADKTFSIVQFATEGELISLMESNTEALSTIDELYYTGGITNHAEAISECRRSLSASLAFQQSETTPHQNIMMLITDGKPTTPDDDPLGSAKREAIKAKEEDGVFIIPVFITPRYDADALSFMRGLSSNDKVFDVVDFESLNTLKDQLVKEVSCSL